jgi:lipopolysaccharide heptosyltransferase II
VVQSLPLLPALRQRFRAAKITWVIQHGLEDLVAGHPDLDDFIVFHRQGTWRDWRRLWGELWSRRFDLVIDLQGLLRTGVMTAATRAPLRVGLETAREGSHWTLTHVLPDTGRHVPAWERYLRVLDAVHADRSLAKTQIAVSAEDEQWAERQLAELPRPILAVHPGARWVTKRWPSDKFAEVLIKVSRSWNAGILLLGSPSERTETEQLAAKLATAGISATVRNRAGQTTLKQLAALLQRVDAVISNDSGPMHLAAGLGTPTLGIFTCTDAVRSGPAGDRHETVSTQMACAGGYHKTCPHAGLDHLACFRELATARVWSALQKLVQKNDLLRRRSAA